MQSSQATQNEVVLIWDAALIQQLVSLSQKEETYRGIIVVATGQQAGIEVGCHCTQANDVIQCVNEAPDESQPHRHPESDISIKVCERKTFCCVGPLSLWNLIMAALVKR